MDPTPYSKFSTWPAWAKHKAFCEANVRSGPNTVTPYTIRKWRAQIECYRSHIADLTRDMLERCPHPLEEQTVKVFENPAQDEWEYPKDLRYEFKCNLCGLVTFKSKDDLRAGQNDA